MIPRLFLCLCMIGFAGNLLLPAKQKPLTSKQLQAKAKQASKAKLCAKAKRRKSTLELCKKWGYA